MSTTYSGNKHDRIERLKNRGRDCHANNHDCDRAAVEVYHLWPANGFGTVTDGAQLERRQTCSYHRKEYTHSGRWVVEGVRRMSAASPVPQQRDADDENITATSSAGPKVPYLTNPFG